MTKKETPLEKANRQLQEAYKVIDGQQKEIEEIRNQYKNTISQQEYESLLKQYKALEERYKHLEMIHNKSKQKKHNERGAGRKPLDENIIKRIQELKNENMTINKIKGKLAEENIKISVGVIHKVIKDLS